MEQGGFGAGAEVIPLRVRGGGGGLAGQSLKKIGAKVIAVEREVGHMNLGTKNRRFHNSLVIYRIYEEEDKIVVSGVTSKTPKTEWVEVGRIWMKNDVEFLKIQHHILFLQTKDATNLKRY
jgi:hypothetical protein